MQRQTHVSWDWSLSGIARQIIQCQTHIRLGLTAHTCNPSTGSSEAGSQELSTGLGYTVGQWNGLEGNDLNLILGFRRWKERTNSHKLSSELDVHLMAQAHTPLKAAHLCVHTEQINNTTNFLSEKNKKDVNGSLEICLVNSHASSFYKGNDF